MHIRNTDILNYETRTAITYGANYDRNQFAREIGQNNLKIAKLAYPILKEKLELPDTVWIRVCGIKSPRWDGRYWSSNKIAEVDYRLASRQFLEVLCHELVHAEQYQIGKLNWIVKGSRSLNCWNGEVVTGEYRSLPWEKEAFERQVILANQVMVESEEIKTLVI
jgi:hypothetical protein